MKTKSDRLRYLKRKAPIRALRLMRRFYAADAQDVVFPKTGFLKSQKRKRKLILMSKFEHFSVYHIYPLGFCGAPTVNDYSEPVNRLQKIVEAVPHIKAMGFNAIYFGPVFKSVAHGYDTVDYTKIDNRLGTNEDFAALCNLLHENGIAVIVDGVFNHVGRDFEKFLEVRRGNNRYRDWFHIHDGNSPYNDGFYYEGWEGHYELVKLNLYNPEVKEYIKQCITGWYNEFKIDGIRLDVAYCLDQNFLKELHGHCKWVDGDMWLMGETLHGDYNRWMNPEMLDSVTNYECYKGLFSSFNDLNMFEIAHSLNRQFGKEQWCLYRGKLLYCFVDNHDVTRIATILKNKQHLNVIYPLVYTMPGIPSVYYGSEFGIEGDKHHGDAALRPEFNLERFKNEGLCDLTPMLTALNNLRTTSSALAYGDYTQVHLTNRQYAFKRTADGQTVVTVLNADNADFTFNLGIGGEFTDVLTGKPVDLSAPLTLGGCKAVVAVSK